MKALFLLLCLILISLKNTYNVAEKVRQSVEQNDFGIGHDFITISLGIGEYITKDSIEQFRI